MKKIIKLVSIILVVFLVTGCGDDINCKKEYNDNIKYKVTIKARVSDNKVFQAKAIMRFDKRADAKHMCDLNKMITNENVSIQCDDNYVYIYGYEYLETVSGEKSISKNEFINKLKEQGFTC